MFDTRYTEEGCSKETPDISTLQCAQGESDFLVCFVLFCFIVHKRENIQRHLPKLKAERGGGRLDMASEKGILARDRD